MEKEIIQIVKKYFDSFLYEDTILYLKLDIDNFKEEYIRYIDAEKETIALYRVEQCHGTLKVISLYNIEEVNLQYILKGLKNCSLVSNCKL